ncbi:MAG TPA: PP2C family protein-serine/threonine phosphatase [Terracidiphilus sp.]|nr:PP2C family protein-serine/threonine phosphatase [Terracidiphilus sp.]
MNVKSSSVWRFYRKQIIYVGLSAALVAIFWAIGQPAPFAPVLVYTLCTGNLLSVAMERAQFLFSGRPFPYNWVIFLAVLMVLSIPVYLISTTAVWLIIRPASLTLPDLLEAAWRVPLVATLVFGGVSFRHQTTKDRLEQRNRELQQSVETGAQQLELQAQEMQRAREIQQSLLPKEIPQLARFEVAASWRPAREVSGDYYDVFRLDEHRLGVCIADVVGKGVAAALLMANVQAAVRAYASSAENAAQLCAKVNLLLCENLATGKFVTFLYGVLDNESRTFDYCNAGNVYPILVSQGTARSMEAGGAALGVFPEWKYENVSISLNPGDRMLLVTDGITEAYGPDEVEFGEERLALAALAGSKRTAAEMSRLLLEEVSKFCGSRFHDDATLLVIAAK